MERRRVQIKDCVHPRRRFLKLGQRRPLQRRQNSGGCSNPVAETEAWVARTECAGKRVFTGYLGWRLLLTPHSVLLQCRCRKVLQLPGYSFCAVLIVIQARRAATSGTSDTPLVSEP